MNRDIIRLRDIVRQATKDRKEMVKALRNPSYPFISGSNKAKLAQLVNEHNSRIGAE